MIENYLGYLEICMKLYANQKENQEMLKYLTKYENLLHNEYDSMDEKEKESLKEILDSKIMAIKMEKSSIIMAQTIMLKDSQLKRIFPGHVKAQYSDKLKKIEKEIHYLESIERSLYYAQGISR